MLFIETIVLCALFFGICYCNTGSDEKNIKSYSSYPDEVQKIVKENAVLSKKIRYSKPLISFISNFLVFGIVLFLFGFFIRQESFVSNFINLFVLGQVLNAFDFLIIDLAWWRNSKRVRFTIAENNVLYKDPKKHFVSFSKGILVFLLVAIVDGWLLSHL